MIQARAGKELTPESLLCPLHRGSFGIWWTRRTKYCALPDNIAAHKRQSLRYSGISKSLCDNIQATTGQLIHVGASICRMCFDLYSVSIPESEEDTGTEDNVKSSSDKGSNFSPDLGRLSQFSNSSVRDEHYQISLSNLSAYGESIGLSPTKHMTKQLSDYAPKQKEYHVRHTSLLIAGILKTVAKDKDPNELLQEVLQSKYLQEELNIESDNEEENPVLEQMVELYLALQSGESQKDLLEYICSNFTETEVLDNFEISKSTYYRYKSAYERKVSGYDETESEYRETLSPNRIDHFMDFITSPHVMKDLPYGSKHMKLSNGMTVEIPNVVRAMVPERIVAQYMSFCNENKYPLYSRSTYLRILDDCTATTRKALAGVDNFQSAGIEAYDDLESIVDQIRPFKETSWGKDTQKKLLETKQYLKSEFRVRLFLMILAMHGVKTTNRPP